ncbi:MAG TPA: FAD-dependent oxidoreductase [Steroidobacteraceae bacterium]|nr:FAD-dependent oxidoreductase [Steroidobacteraceae bacterium]
MIGAAPQRPQRACVEESAGPAIRATPLWQDQVAAPALAQLALPPEVDVLIVGGGYTGLSAARETAAAGLDTLVLEGGAVGTGCSGRNGGQVAYSLKPTLAKLSALHGPARAFAICREGFAALDYLRSLAAGDVECDWRDCGCFFGAHTGRHFESMARDAERQPAGLEQRIIPVPRSEQHREIASDYYHGGCLYPDDACLDPMKLLIGLLRRAQAQGARIQDHCPAQALRRARGGFEVLTSRGVVRARKVLLATNGYSGALSAWHRRRVIPIGSYQICTEPLGRERVRALIPLARNIVDARRVVVYFRPSPDGERIVFGGRAALGERDPLACVARLRSMLTAIFPQLRAARFDHAWVGWVAYTFDTMPHLGGRDGLFYCMGYCGQGVPLAPYLGMRIGQQMAGIPEGRTALDGLAFAARFYYFGKPWFLAPSVWAYRVMDRFGL